MLREIPKTADQLREETIRALQRHIDNKTGITFRLDSYFLGFGETRTKAYALAQTGDHNAFYRRARLTLAPDHGESLDAAWELNKKGDRSPKGALALLVIITGKDPKVLRAESKIRTKDWDDAEKAARLARSQKAVQEKAISILQSLNLIQDEAKGLGLSSEVVEKARQAAKELLGAVEALPPR